MELGDEYGNGCIIAIYENGFITFEDGIEKVYINNIAKDISTPKYECCWEDCYNRDMVCEWINLHPDYIIINVIKNGFTDVSSYTVFYYNTIESDASKAKRLGNLIKKSPFILNSKFIK